MAQSIQEPVSDSFDEITKRICWLRGITELLRSHDPECETNNLGWLLDGIIDGIADSADKMWQELRKKGTV